MLSGITYPKRKISQKGRKTKLISENVFSIFLCFARCMCWQTPSQSNIILFTICFMCWDNQTHTHTHSLEYSNTILSHRVPIMTKMSTPMKWNGMVKIRSKGKSKKICIRGKATERVREREKNDESGNWSYIMSNARNHTDCAMMKIGEKTSLSMWIRCTIAWPGSTLEYYG